MKFLLLLISMLMFLSCEQKNTTEWTLDIIHTNDIHGHALVPSETAIGYATIMNNVEALREEGKTVWLVDAGDAIQGTALTNLDRGASTIKVMNLMGYTAAAVGNHEFDFGSDHFISLTKEANFPWLAANVTYNGKHPFLPYVIKKVNGTRIALIGLTTPETLWKTHPNNVKGFTFTSPIATMQDLMPTLKKKADVIIVLAHLGQEGDYTSDALARTISGIDLIIDGHDHGALRNGLIVNKTLIVNTGAYSANLGFVELTIKNNQVQSINAKLYDVFAEELNAGYTMRPQAQEVADFLAKIQAQGAEQMNRVVLTNSMFLSGNRDSLRTSDSALGHLIADAMRDESGADIAIMNAGGIRAGLPVGEVTYGTLLSILPFDNLIYTINVSGSQLKEALEWGVSRFPEPNGGFLQVSGITFDVNPNAEPNARVSNIKVGYTPIEMHTSYLLAAPDFITAGGDGFTMLELPVISQLDLISASFVRYIQQNSHAISETTVTRINILS